MSEMEVSTSAPTGPPEGSAGSEAAQTPPPTVSFSPSELPSFMPSWIPENCTADTDCGHDDFFCVLNSTCCKYNTTCRIGGIVPKSGSSMVPLSFTSGVYSAVFFGLIVAFGIGL